VQILHLVAGKTARVRRLAALDLLLPSCIVKEQRHAWTICVILVILWVLGMVTSYTADGLIHILLAIALVALVIRLIQGRRIPW
jgi:hypothetical protein